MRIWADAWYIDGSGREEGPIDLVQFTLTRVLDGVGSFSLSAPLTASRVRRLLTTERRVDLYAEHDGIPRLVGSGIITNVVVSVRSGQYILEASGPDLLQELVRQNTYLNRQYDDTLTNIVTDLALLAGWSVVTSGSFPNLAIRFDGNSAMNAIITATQAVGGHVRVGSLPQQIEVGPFGVSQSIFATNQVTPSDLVNLNDRLLLIDSIQVGEASDAVVNWLLPLGGGEGAAALTLERSTRTPIFTLVGPGGETLYYITDPASITAIGKTIQATRSFKSISPLANDTPSLISAADSLYDAARAWLDRYSQKIQTYRLRVRKVNTLLRPGDKIRVLYTGEVTSEDDTADVYLTIDDFFFVMKVSEQHSGSPYTDLEVSTIDRFFPDAVQQVAENIKGAEVLAVKPLPGPFVFNDTVVREIGGVSGQLGIDATYPLHYDDLMTDVSRVVVSFSIEAPVAVTRVATTTQAAAAAAQVDMQYSRGPLFPQGVHFFLDAVDLSVAKGGPWNGPLTTSIDITEEVRAAGKGTHILKFTVAAGSAVNPQPTYVTGNRGDANSGRILMCVQVLGTSQAIS